MCARARAFDGCASATRTYCACVTGDDRSFFFFFCAPVTYHVVVGSRTRTNRRRDGCFVVVQIIIARCVCRVLYVRRVNISYRPKRTYGFRLHLFLFFSFFCFFFCRYSWVSPCNSVRWLFCFFYKQISSPLDRVNIFFSLYTIAFSLSSRHRFPLFH